MSDPRIPSSVTDSGDDERLLRQVRAVLEPLPPVDRRAIAQIMTKVAERERAPRSWIARSWETVIEWWRFDVPPMARGSALVATALVLGFVARGALPTNGAGAAGAVPQVATTPATAPAPMAAPITAPMIAAEGTVDPTAMRIPVQFVLDAREIPRGTTVSVVGDFNDWDVSAAPMTLENGAWSVTLPILPGRHVYAFVVDGETWIADPRATKAPDADFGRPGSVIIVQTP